MRHEPHNDDEAQRVSPFESIRRTHPDGYEYWSARDLSRVLGYKQYNKFVRVIEKAEVACENSGYMVEDHFTHASEMVEIGSGAKREFDTVFLSRYACYLIVQNADPDKPIVALGQTYFAVQTRRRRFPPWRTSAACVMLPVDLRQRSRPASGAPLPVPVVRIW